MRTHSKILMLFALAAAIAMTPATGCAQTSAAPPKFSPNVPTKITTPNTVETRIGTLHFTDGTPDVSTSFIG